VHHSVALNCAHRRRGNAKSSRSLKIRPTKSLSCSERNVTRKKKPWASRRIPKGVRGNESPIRQERAGTQRNRWRHRHNRVRRRQNPVFQSFGEEPIRKPTAGIGARMTVRNKPCCQKCQRGTNVRRVPPLKMGTHISANTGYTQIRGKAVLVALRGTPGDVAVPPTKALRQSGASVATDHSSVEPGRGQSSPTKTLPRNDAEPERDKQAGVLRPMPGASRSPTLGSNPHADCW
jgi:hypothetical protein